MSAQLLVGDCREQLANIPNDSIDAIVTDPPYELGFMGKAWDASGIAYNVDVWRECLRVLKPGGHLLAFSGSRTYHRMACAIEDAGFEIRDQIQWVFGSGFPKSHNLKGNWQGWGTALKPAHEPICMARKPFKGTVAENVLEYGTGAINVDGCRVGSRENDPQKRPASASGAGNGKLCYGTREGKAAEYTAGRWPANFIHDGSDEVVAGFPETTSGGKSGTINKVVAGKSIFGNDTPGLGGLAISDSGSAARFFYCAKASKADRDEGCEGLEARVAGVGDVDEISGRDSTKPGNQYGEGSRRRVEAGLSPTMARRNHHPTVKPTALMRYLCRLITPPGGTVLDPFTGSGSTGKAAMLEGFDFIGIEMSPEYAEIAQARINFAKGIF